MLGAKHHQISTGVSHEHDPENPERGAGPGADHPGRSERGGAAAARPGERALARLLPNWFNGDAPISEPAFPHLRQAGGLP